MGLRNTPLNNQPEVARCKFGRLYHEAFDDDDRQVFAEWVEAQYGRNRILRGLKQGGYSIGSSTLERHMAQTCHCEQPDDPLYGHRGYR